MSTSRHDETAPGHTNVAILFADVSGSTELYEVHGDALARETIAVCVEILSDIVSAHRGRVVKTIGDEIMAAFGDPAQAIVAAQEMQGSVRRAGEEGRFRTGALRIKVGFHFGLGLEEAAEVHGEAPAIAQDLIKLAKADQVLTSRETLEAAPDTLLVSSRPVGRHPVRDGAQERDVYEVLWDVTGLTVMAGARPVPRAPEHSQLELTYNGQTARVDEDNPELTIGRIGDHALVVNSGLTSRQHAQISYRAGRFRLEDYSANGTVVVAAGGRTTTLRREHHNLRGKGILCFGGTPDTNPEGVVEYECI